MLSDLTPFQRALADAMSGLSEDHWCAGWLIDLEFELWKILEDNDGSYNGWRLPAQDIERLRALSDLCGGWIVYDRERCETFVPLDEWHLRFAEFIARVKPEDF